MARKLRKYRFGGVERLSRAQVRATNALTSFLPQTPFDAGFKDRLRAVLEPLVHVDVDLWLDEIRAVEAGGLPRLLGSPFCVAVVGLAPKPERALIQVDLPIAQQTIDRLLGGATEDTDDQRQLSEIEEGVFSFLLLKVLRLIQDEAGDELQVGLRLEGIAGDLETLRPRFDVDTAATVLSFKLFFDVAVGVCRVIVPSSLISRDLESISPVEGPALSRRLKGLRRRAPRVALVKSALSVEIGRIALAPDDLAGLERGDIILVEGAEVRLEDGALHGRVKAHVGRGHHGAIHGTLSVGGAGRYEVAVDEILAVAPPPSDGALGNGEYEEEENAMVRSRSLPHGRLRAALDDDLRRRLSGTGALLPTDRGPGFDEASEHSDDEGGEEAYEEEEPVAEAANLLGDVTVSMVVELGRLDVSASDVLGLRAGQVIELSRTPGDPVDLVVDGKRVGKGEVVEIEGELGVRILSLVK